MSEITELAAETLHLQRTARVAGDPRLLIIDDEEAIRESLDTLLTLEGFSVSTAVDGPSGMELLSRNEYDLLLLDLNLPDITGEEVLRRLRARPESVDVPVLILSADSTSRNITRLLQSGADAYLTKPFEVPHLAVPTNERAYDRDVGERDDRDVAPKACVSRHRLFRFSFRRNAHFRDLRALQ